MIIALDSYRQTTAGSAPNTISGLVRAWRPDAGVTVGADGITEVAGAWGTSVPLTQGTSARRPDVGAGLAVDDSDLFDFTAADSEQFDMASLSLTAFTVIVAASQKSQGAAQAILGAAVSSVTYIQCGGATDRMQVRGGAGDANHNLILPRRLSKNLEIIAITYDGATGIAYLDGVAGTPATVGAWTFTFDKVGALGATANDLDAYLGPLLIYDRALNAAELGQLYAYLAPKWKGTVIYVAADGSDASASPWKQATPLASPSLAIDYAAFNVEVALKGGDVFRELTTRINASTSGLDANRRCKMSGSRWGTGKAQIRFSDAPDVVNTAGTIYSLDGVYTSDTIPIGLDPGVSFGYVYYVPGGTPTFTRDGLDVSTNVVRLTYEATTTTPASGKWSFSGSTIYVNAGVALSNGEIEVWHSGDPDVSSVAISLDNWLVEDVVAAFGEGSGWVNKGGSNVKLMRLEAWFCGNDGFDGFDNTGLGLFTRNFELEHCISAWNGRGPTSGGAPGDGFSMHDTAQADLYDCESWYNDKSGAVHQSPSNTRSYRCLYLGSKPVLFSSSGGGSMYLENCIAVVPDGALYPHGFTNGCTDDSLMTVRHATVVSLSSGADGNGINQLNAAARIDARNSIVTGFENAIAGIAGQTTITADHNCLNGNGANYLNVTAGAGDITGDPLFADDPTDLSVQAASPCKALGDDLDVSNDYSGIARSGTAPTVGAYE